MPWRGAVDGGRRTTDDRDHRPVEASSMPALPLRLLVPVLLAVASTADASPGTDPDVLAPEPPDPAIVVGDGDATWRALFGAGTGPVQAVPLRHVFGSVYEAAQLVAFRDDVAAGEGFVPVTTTALERGDVRWRFVLGGGTLAIARIAPDYALLDALTVQTDPGGYPGLVRGFVMGATAPAPAVLIVNSHVNSQEGFAQHMLVALVDGELRALWEGPLLYSLSTGDDTCDVHRIEQTLVHFRKASSAAIGPPYFDVRFRETETCEKDGDTVAAPARDFSVMLEPDATGRYVGTLPELEALNAERRGD
jgi:hypothetical protein